MKKLISVLSILLLSLLVGCNSVSTGSVTVESNELSIREAMTMELAFNYTNPLGDVEPTSFSVQFITGDNLEIRKERNGQGIEEDLIINVTGSVNEKYFVVAIGNLRSQKVQSVEAVITSRDKKITKRFQSDFILVTN